MRISKERLDKIKSRGKAVARGAVSGSKSTVFEGASGVGVAYAEQLLTKNFEVMRTRPWAPGAAFVVAGHFLKRKKSMSNLGAAVVGAGGLLLGQYLRNRKATASTTTNTQAPVVTPPVAPPAPPPETSGFDTGRVVRFPRSDAGFVVRSAARAV